MVKRAARAKWWKDKSQTNSFTRFATWNVRSLVESEGSIETASSRGHVVEDKKIIRVVETLRRYDIDIAGLQETFWFGNSTFRVDDRVVLTSGRVVPSNGESCRRGEGVALVFGREAMEAWRAGGCIVEPVSSRLMYARLKFKSRYGETKWLRVICAYAPTYRSSRSEKDKFFDELQTVLNSVQYNEEYVLLGDLNARLGSRAERDEWSAVRGPHGCGELNTSGEELLSFLSMNEATVCNTWFRKKSTQKQTWQHPRTKQWHCIDFVIVSQYTRRRCLDCQVITSAECGSDHSLLYMKFALCLKRHHARRGTNIVRKNPFNIEKLVSKDPRQQNTICELQSTLRETLEASPPDNLSLEETWFVLRDSLVSTADNILGRRQRPQPDWYRDNSDIISPLLSQRNRAYTNWVQHGRQDHHYHEFKALRKASRSAIRRAQQYWVENVAAEAEQSRFDSGRVWKSIRALQHASKGLVPTRIRVVKDETGEICTTAAAQCQRWHRHFSHVLNVPSSLNLTVLDSIPQRPVHDELDAFPSQSELQVAIDHLRNGKAAGNSEIPSELLKAGGAVFSEALSRLLEAVWREERVPHDWINSIIVPIPKKGDLSNCDNWRGIALLDVVGKAVARIIQTRLQTIAEEVLPDSQCGFRRQRSCSDMIFSVRQLGEKAIEHHSKAFFVFVDLKKAYDSVPRDGLWPVLLRLGVPSKLVNIIRAFHTDMSASLRLNGGLSESIGVQNGLRQGCTMAPVLFNLYMCAVIECWVERLQGASDVGIDIRYKFDGQLLRKPRRQLLCKRITECQFADDAVLFAITRSGLQLATEVFADVVSDFGLTVSFTKTKFMAVGSGIEDLDVAPIHVGDSLVDNVSEFPYLGSLIDSSGRSTVDIRARIASASRAFGALRKPVFQNRHLSTVTKRHVFSACVLSLLLYGAECWVTLQDDVRRLNTFYMACIRSILGITRRDVRCSHLTNVQLLAMWGDERTISVILMQRRMEWLGHVARMSDDRIPKSLLFGLLPCSRPPGGPRKRWRDCAIADLKAIGAPCSWYTTATTDRYEWRSLYRTNQVPSPPVLAVSCSVCNRQFSRQSGLRRHKCLDERALPIHEQRGAVECTVCNRWFKSAGGKAVHKCSPALTVPTAIPAQHTCPTCERVFSSSSGMQRHRCASKRPSSNERAGFDLNCGCGRRFRREQDIMRHQRFCDISSTSTSPRIYAGTV